MVIINISNCKNIMSGSITIHDQKLNIFFGRNGTGKSTIAESIRLVSKGKSLNSLAPYGNLDNEAVPSIDGVEYNEIAIFDDNYVRQYVYQADSLIENAFEVFLRSPEYDEAKANIDFALAKVKTTITDNESIKALREQIGILISNIEFNSDKNTLSKRKGGIKGVLTGKGAYFNPPSELNALRPFFVENTVSKWAAWRLQGYNDFGAKGCCPYCSTDDSENTSTINRVFTESFDKASVEYVTTISKAMSALSDYLDEKKVEEFLSLFGIKENIPILESQIIKLGAEAHYLHNRLSSILSFNGSSVNKENIADLETKLKDMKIDLRACDSYFTTEKTKNVANSINTEIDGVLQKVGVLKGEIGKYNKHIQDKIRDRKQDINEFLSLAGFKYSFDVIVDGENSAKALLKFVLPDGKTGDTQTSGNQLSWGEKHSFALILFMFDAIRSNADLIVLDDPISSFDRHKKYAIMNRLFKTGERGNSLYEKTVLMLTHDFEPIIDYIQTNSGRQTSTSVYASYFENIKGILACTSIKKDDDLISSVVLFKELAMDSGIDIAARIGCLRKFIEHQYKNPLTESIAYNILSSLIHKREIPTFDLCGDNRLTTEQINEGTEYIRKFIPDFDYAHILEENSAQNLLERFSKEQSAYIKMLILRSYVESSPEARTRLRNQNDILRKYIDETYHIENDYIYSLDVRRFNIVPENYEKFANDFVEREQTQL